MGHVKRQSASNWQRGTRERAGNRRAVAQGVRTEMAIGGKTHKNAKERSFLLRTVFAAAAAAAVAGCGPRLEEGADARIRVTPARQVTFSRVTVGESRALPFVVTSVGRDNLELEKIVWEGSDAVRIAVAGELPRVMPNAASFPVSVEFAPTAEHPSPDGVIRIYTNDPDTPIYSLGVAAQQLFPQINVVPSAQEGIIIGQTDIGRTSEKTVVVTNTGDLPLTVSEIRLTADASFGYAAEGGETLPAVLPANAAKALRLKVSFAPESAGKREGTLSFVSDDPNHPIYDVPIVANSDTPCLRISPSLVEFSPSVSVGASAQKTVLLQSCSAVPLTVSDVRQTSGSGAFSSKLTGGGKALENGESATLTIEYAPSQIGTDNAKYVVISNDPLQPNAEISVMAAASDNRCPEAVASAKIEGSSIWSKTLDAAPLDRISLDGSQSSDPEGSALKYYWTIQKAPADSVAAIAVSSSDPSKASFFVDLAGDYSLCLSAEDAQGMLSCNTDCVTISAVPRETIHIQLVWSVPGVSPTQTVGSGGDVDLHFLTLPDGKWNDLGQETLKNGTDVFWLNPNPVWQIGSTAENPSLDIDSKTGSEPENINLDKPNACRWYAVGAHYYNDYAWGPAYATIRAYISGKLRFEKTKIKLSQTSVFKQIAWIFWNGETAFFYETDFAADSDEGWQNMTPFVPDEILEKAKISSKRCFD